MKESSEKHAAEAKAVAGKEGAKAEVEASLQKTRKEMKTSQAEAKANSEFLASLHKECDWLLKNHKVRQQARTSEIDSLRKAKGVLTGADGDASFLQIQKDVRHNLRQV